MNYFNNIFSFIFVLNLVLANAWPFPTYFVYIHDALPDHSSSLTLRCQSKDNDLGYKVINVNEEYSFYFSLQIFDRTLFFCHFYWNNKDLRFDVFNKHIIDHCKGTDGDLGREPGMYECHWKVQEDGFYFASSRKDEYEKKYDW